MSGAPLVSVVIPAFNRLPHLEAAIDSVFNQSARDFELVVADDGSDEATRGWLRGIAARPACTVLRLEHSGSPARVRNAALRAARGRYVAFLDSDDLWLPHKLERQLAALRGAPGPRWCYTAFLRIEEGGAVLAAERERPWTPHHGEIFDAVVRGAASIRTPSVLAERALLEEANGFDESLRACEDYDLWMRLAMLSPIALVDEPLVRVRLSRDSLTRGDVPVFADREASLRKLEARVTGARRALLRAERARNARGWAQRCAARGRRADAIAVLAGSVGYSWPYPRWWWGAFRSLTGGRQTGAGS